MSGGPSVADADPGVDGKRRWLAVVSWLFLVLGCVLAPLAVVGAWAKYDVMDTDRYVAKVAPLSSDPVIQAAVADRVTEGLASSFDLDELLQGRLDALVARGMPPRVVERLLGNTDAVEARLSGFVHDQVVSLLGTDTFQRLWLRANRTAHAGLIAALSGEGRGVLTGDDAHLIVDLGVVAEEVRARLVDRGITVVQRLPGIDFQVTLIEGPRLTQARTAYSLVDRFGFVVPVVALALLVLGVALAHCRRVIIGTLRLGGTQSADDHRKGSGSRAVMPRRSGGPGVGPGSTSGHGARDAGSAHQQGSRA